MEGPKARGLCDEPWALHNTSDATRKLPPQTSVSTGRVRPSAVVEVRAGLSYAQGQGWRIRDRVQLLILIEFDQKFELGGMQWCRGGL